MNSQSYRKGAKILLITILSAIFLVLLIPAYIVIKNIQNDMPLREYVKFSVLPRLKNDLNRFFTFSENSKVLIPVLNLEIDESELSKLEEMRSNRLAEIEQKKTINMGQNHWDFVNAKIIHNNKEHLIKIRIRGDMPSNYNRGLEKASYRFNIESNSTLFGKKKLSIVRAFLENNFYGYLFSHFMNEEGFVSNEVMFVRLLFNGKDAGICFLQEGFSKELVESSDYREGIIFRFKNDCIDNNGVYNFTGIPELTAYRKKRTLKDTTLSKKFSRAITKFDLLKNKKLTTEQCFNIDKFAKYLALCDIFLAHHSYVCHNAKLYFNPVNDKFEPIAWDPSSFMRYNTQLPVSPGFNNFLGEIYNNNKRYPLYQYFFTDTAFIKKFNNYVFQYSNNGSVTNFVKQYEETIAFIDPILYRQRFQNKFQSELITGNIQSINNWFTTDTRLNAKIFRDDGKLIINSTLPLTLYLTTMKLDSANEIALNRILLPFQSDTISVPKSQIGLKDGKFTLYSSIYGFDEMQKYKGNIFEKMDQYNSPVITETTDSSVLKFDVEKKIISFKTDKIIIRKNVYVPPGYKFILNAGSEIFLINHSNIISESSIEAIGNENKKIIIRSNGTGGLFVKNCNISSVFEYVEFDNLASPQSGNWSLTGAVTFYENDVSINNCFFKNNISEDALNIIRSKFTIENSFVSHTFADAIDIDFSYGKIINTVIENIKNDGLDFSGSHVEVKNITLTHIGDKAVSGGENTIAHIENMFIEDSFIGISSKDKSYIKTENIIIENTRYTLASYQKKVEYGPATISVNNYKSKNRQNNFMIEDNSLLIINGDSVKGNAANVYNVLYKKM